MDRFHLMNVFVAVAESEGFAGGARRLGMSPPAVTRAVARLEKNLGAKLLTRTTRHVRVTDVGAQYLNDAKRILADVHAVDDAVRGSHHTLSGHVGVTAPVLFGRQHVMPAIVDYLARYPDTTVDALLVDRVVNLIEEGVDVAVRIGDLPDSTEHAANAGKVRRVVCAAPAYLKEHGAPKRPGDLKRHTLIVSSSISSRPEWHFIEDGRAVAFKPKPRLAVTHNDAAIEAAVLGFGVARLLSYQVAPFIAAGKLAIVLRRFEPPALPVHLVYREGRQASARIRAFVDLTVARLRAEPALR